MPCHRPANARRKGSIQNSANRWVEGENAQRYVLTEATEDGCAAEGRPDLPRRLKRRSVISAALGERPSSLSKALSAA